MNESTNSKKRRALPNRVGRERARALRSRSKSFFQRFWEFLKNILLLFRQNPKELSLFLLFCAVFTMLGTALLKNVLIALMMKVSGASYITPDNLKAVVLHPASLLLILLFALIVTLFSLFEIAGLLHAFSMAQVGRDTNLNSMFMAGLRTCRKALKPQNWALMLFIMVLFPLTKVLPLSSSTAKLILPGFVNQTINYTRSLRIAYGAFYVALCAFIVVYIFSVNIFVLQKFGFVRSCDHSRRLGAGRYLETALMMMLLTVLLNFIINSVASILVINARELVGFFQSGSNSGVVSKSAEMGEYTYALRQVMKSLLSPAVNNAALTVLFYRYIEERELIGTLSHDVFLETEASRRSVAAFLCVIALVSAVSGGYLVNKYAFLRDSVDAPLVCAHRGDNVNAPENTMPAFELAASENMPWIELDVHQTADGVLVCNHDAGIGRVTGKNLTIHDSSYEELTRYEIGSWMPGSYEHVVIPTLEEVLRMAKEEGLKVQVELKGHPEDRNYEENILQVINDTGMHDEVMIIAQDAYRLQRIQELDPTVLKGYCMFIALGNIEEIPYTDNVSIEENNVTPELVQRLHEKGMKVFCWTVDLEDTIQYLVSCDVDVIGTDNPMLVSSALGQVDYSGGFRRGFHILLNTLANMDK